MGFLNPVFLLAGLAVAVPVFLHLFYRRESKTFTFPAIRYLLRTERERARQIRTQQVLLLLLRAAVVAVVVLMGARAHFPGPGRSHEATALAVVIDNSASATVIEDGRRRLDVLKEVARRSAEGAGPDDVIWVIRAGTPWQAATPGNATQAMAAIDETGPSHGRGELLRAVARARALVAQSDLPAREVHLITDLQATAFAGDGREYGDVGGYGDSGGPGDSRGPSDAADSDGSDGPGDSDGPADSGGSDDSGGSGDSAESVPVVVFGAPAAGVTNRGIGSVVFGGGLVPLAGRRTETAVSVAGGAPDDTVGVRLYVDGLVRGAARAPAGATVRVPAGPFSVGRVEGWAEIDPDPLTADDRRYFSFAVRDPTPVAVLGDAPIFVRTAAAVLAESGRIALESGARTATLVSAGGEGLDGRTRDQAVIAYPVADAVRLPALNRRLADAGIPFRYLDRGSGGSRVTSASLPVEVEGLDVARYFVVEPTGALRGPASPARQSAALRQTRTASAGALRGPASPVVAELANGDPWLLAGAAPTGPYVLVASPLDEASSGLPVSAAMVPLLEWAVDRWSGAGAGVAAISAGDPIRPPPTATAVRDPNGVEHPVDGDQPFPATAVAGLYRALAGDSVLETFAVNAPAAETDLAPLDRESLRQALPGAVAVVSDPESWPDAIFRAGRGPEPWRTLAVLLLALLVVESGVAASTRVFSRPGRGAAGPATPAQATPRRATPAAASRA